ncbi:MAG: MAPEG family protein [Panacagrimonas sp.]
MSPLAWPVGLYVLYVFALFLALAVVRVRAVKRGEVGIEYFSTYSGTPPPERMVVLGRHYDNQFQVPLLFMASCAALIPSSGHDTPTVALAWAFVAARLLHSFVHLFGNVVVRRLQAYALGWLVLIVLWGRQLFLV